MKGKAGNTFAAKNQLLFYIHHFHSCSMKNKFILFPLLFALSIAACNKKDKKQFSTWTVNGKIFSTNEVTTDLGKAICILSSNDINNRFTFGFAIGVKLPIEGNFLISHVKNDDPDKVVLSFYYKGNFMKIAPSQNTAVAATDNNGKALYTLPPTWYVYFDHQNDSVLISGTFNAP